MARKSNKKKNDIQQIPGYYYDSEKNKYFKIESNASASASSQRFLQEKSILRERTVVNQKLKAKSNAASYADSLPKYFSKLLHARSIHQSLAFVREASEILLKNYSRRVVHKLTRSSIQASTYHFSSGRLMMIKVFNGYSKLISLKKNGSDCFIEAYHGSFLDGCVPSWMCGNKESLVMTFLGSDSPIKVWDYENDSLDSIFPGQINHDIWSCCIDHNGNICLIGNGSLFRISRLSSYVSRSAQVRIRDEFGKSDALCMEIFSKYLLATGHRNGYIGLFDSRVKKEVGIIKEKSAISCLKPFSFNSDHSDDYFLSSNMDSEINLYDTRNMKVVQTFPGHVNTHQRLKCDIFNNSILISPGSDNFIRGWSLSSGTLLWQKLMSPAVYAEPCQLSFNKSLECDGFFTCQSDEISYWSL